MYACKSMYEENIWQLCIYCAHETIQKHFRNARDKIYSAYNFFPPQFISLSKLYLWENIVLDNLYTKQLLLEHFSTLVHCIYASILFS